MNVNGIVHKMRVYWKSFLSLFFPRVCFNCSEPLVEQEEILCLHCNLKIERTNYHKQKDNPLWLDLSTMTTLDEAHALFKYQKKSISRKLIHNLKYKNQKKLGKTLGIWMAQEMLNRLDTKYDAIVPVPLHPRRQRQRGYNQAEELAMGIQSVLGFSIETNWIKRTRYTKSQTQKVRLKRWEGTDSLYALEKGADVKSKKLLIVDDVITTGSTISQMANVLLTQGVQSVSVACLATGK